MFAQLPSAGLSGDFRIPATGKSVAGSRLTTGSLSKRPKHPENHGFSPWPPQRLLSEARPLRRVARRALATAEPMGGKFSSPVHTLNFVIGVPHANDSIANPGSPRRVVGALALFTLAEGPSC
jgi:hypothetical protein